jgi:hypothetical protein
MGEDGNLSTLDKLLILATDDERPCHLACACNPQLTHCGTMQEGAEGIDLLGPENKICADCLKVWQAFGCGRCACGPAEICAACVQSAADGS